MLLKRKVYGFYLNFALWTSILIGFVASASFKIPHLNGVSWLILVVILIFFSFLSRKVYGLVLIALAGFLLSCWRFSDFQQQNQLFKNFIGKQITIQGVLIEDADLNVDSNELSLKILVNKIDDTAAKGKIFAKIKTKHKIRRSDEVVLRGNIKDGFGSFVGSMPRANLTQIIRRLEPVRDFRDWFAIGISKFISSPELELGLGYLLGQKNSLPSNLEKALRVTALTHIVVASGYNLTVLVNFARRKIGKISKRLATFASIMLVCGFVLVVGFSPSMTRAGIVALLGILFWYFGRKPNPYFLLIFVAAITLLVSPENIFDLGWQLSFGSFFGVMILSPLIKSFLFKNPEKIGSIGSTFFETVSAQISTLPLIIYTFNTFSSVSILANMLVLPFVPLAMLLTFMTGIFAKIFQPLAQFCGFLAGGVLRYSTFVIDEASKISGAQVEVKINAFELVLLYIALAIVVVVLRRFMNKSIDSRV